LSGQALQGFLPALIGAITDTSQLSLGDIMKYCKKCQSETERYKRGTCKPCSRAYVASWKAANRERTKVTNAAWYAANQEKLNAYRAANAERAKAASAAYYAANTEKMKATSVAWRANNKERMKATIATWHAANPESRRASKAVYRAANLDKWRTYRQNRRAKELENGGNLSQGLAERLFKLQKGKCICCNQPLGDDFHLDHIMPLSLGGTNTDDNIQLLREQCNKQKHAKHPIDFMQKRGYLL